MRLNNFTYKPGVYRRTDMVIPIYPLNFVVGGIMTFLTEGGGVANLQSPGPPLGLCRRSP